jgi:hypothetical protein
VGVGEEKGERAALASKGQEVKVVPEVLEAKTRKTKDSRDHDGDKRKEVASSQPSRDWRVLQCSGP